MAVILALGIYGNTGALSSGELQATQGPELPGHIPQAAHPLRRPTQLNNSGTQPMQDAQQLQHP